MNPDSKSFLFVVPSSYLMLIRLLQLFLPQQSMVRSFDAQCFHYYCSDHGTITFASYSYHWYFGNGRMINGATYHSGIQLVHICLCFKWAGRHLKRDFYARFEDRYEYFECINFILCIRVILSFSANFPIALSSLICPNRLVPHICFLGVNSCERNLQCWLLSELLKFFYLMTMYPLSRALQFSSMIITYDLLYNID